MHKKPQKVVKLWRKKNKCTFPIEVLIVCCDKFEWPNIGYKNYANMFSGSFVDVVYSAYYYYTVNQKKTWQFIFEYNFGQS